MAWSNSKYTWVPISMLEISKLILHLGGVFQVAPHPSLFYSSSLPSLSCVHFCLPNYNCDCQVLRRWTQMVIILSGLSAPVLPVFSFPIILLVWEIRIGRVFIHKSRSFKTMQHLFIRKVSVWDFWWFCDVSNDSCSTG